MATKFAIEATGIGGDMTLTGHVGRIAAMGIQDTVLPMLRDADSKVTEVCVFRERDRASPKFMVHAAQGTKISKVKIHILTTSDTTATTVFSWEMEEVYVSRYELDTVDAKGIAYQPHAGKPGVGAASFAGNQTSTSSELNDHRAYARARAGLKPLTPTYPGEYTENRIERVWFSPGKVRWTSTDGNLGEGYDIVSGATDWSGPGDIATTTA